ncbi:MAG: HD domain-containing protein [Phycisphaerae bacterium]|nr:HD domain-containing protein [Phycisphaerae bacterium]
MRQIDATTLRPGVRLPLAFYTRQGVKLLSASTVLTEAMCRMITQSKWGDLFLASSASDLQESALLRLVEPAGEGTVAPADVVTAGGVLAVEAGERIERHHAEAYELGAFLGTPEKEDQRLRAARMKIADQCVLDLSAEWSRLPLRIRSAPTPAWAAPRAAFGPTHAEWPDETRLADFRGERVRRFQRVFARILSGLPVALGEVSLLVAELVHLQRTHPERFTQLALLAPRGEDYLPEHCYAVACLSVAIAARLQWSDDHVRLAGLAGLLSDVGMGLVPADLRISGRTLSEMEINRVRRHPTYSVVMLDAVEGLPETVRRTAYQHHERENGSGYPCGLRGRLICDLAKVVAIADAFAAAAARRRYRSAKRPYEAIEEIIMQASIGVFDKRCVRALVEAAGLFPVGSHVMLSNNTPAVVVGVQPGAIDRPIVRVVQHSTQGTTLGLTVHLTDFSRNELWISQPIDPPTDFAVAG